MTPPSQSPSAGPTRASRGDPDRPLLSHRDWIVWTACLILVSGLLVVTRFTSDDPDSALYAALSARLADGPLSHWISPEWWGHWEMDGWFREHPAGVFLLPTALAALGLPGVQAAYIVGVAAGLGSLITLAQLIARATSRDDGRRALVLLQLMPAAFIFRIRANHEYPMLFCLLIALVGLDRVRSTWSATWIVCVALVSALLVKGVFVGVPLLAAVLWILINPSGAPGSRWRPLVACAIALAAMAGAAASYDAWYRHVTGEPFWGPYWGRQLEPLTIATPIEGGGTLAGHLAFYLLRLLWHPAPWSLLLVAAAWKMRGQWSSWWRSAPERLRGATVFAAAFVASETLLLSPASRFAERYLFSATYAVAAVGVVTACRTWPAIGLRIDAWDRRIPALPAITWLGLMLLRLVLGPLLPRI